MSIFNPDAVIWYYGPTFPDKHGWWCLAAVRDRDAGNARYYLYRGPREHPTDTLETGTAGALVALPERSVRDGEARDLARSSGRSVHPDRPGVLMTTETCVFCGKPITEQVLGAFIYTHGDLYHVDCWAERELGLAEASEEGP